MLKKILIWGAISFLVFFIAFRPGASANVVAALGEVLTDILRGVGDFFGGLIGR